MLFRSLDYIYDRSSGNAEAQTLPQPNPSTTSASDHDSWRLIENLNANFRPTQKLQVALSYGIKFARETLLTGSYQGFTDQVGAEVRYDLTPVWDVGASGSLLHTWATGQLASSAGASVGYNVMENAWASVGYNFWGFEDRDFSGANYTAQGIYARFRFKFDQNSIRGAADWLNKQ